MQTYLKVYQNITIFIIFNLIVKRFIMKEMETIEKFIQLRAEGKSFDKIAKLIKVSKPN